MKTIFKILTLIFFSTLTITSCLSTDKTETTPECAIKSFSVGDIKSDVTVKREGKSDTIITKTISGNTIYFNIDQLNGTITTVDSLASWADLSKVKPTFACNGYVYARVNGEEDYYYLTSGSDSISIEKPLDLMVVSTDGNSTKKYTVTMKKSSTALDEFNWKKLTTDFAVNNDFKALYLNNKIYAFYRNDEGKVCVTYASVDNKLSTWTTSAIVDIDYTSIVVYKDELYALSSDGYVLKAEESSNPVSWTKVSDKHFTRLLSADKYHIYAADEYEIFESADLQEWNSNGKNDIDMLPTRCVDYYSYTSKTNPDIEISMMCGINDNNKDYCTSWYKVSSNDKDVNQKWMYIQITNDNPYGLAAFSDMSSVYYNGMVYATGINPETNKYEYIYCSKDNGITWRPKTDTWLLPEDLDAANGAARLINSNDKIWIIQKGGNIWSGTIR